MEKIYYTYEEFLQMFPQENGFSCDQLSRQIAAELLVHEGINRENIFFTTGCNSTDIVYKTPSMRAISLECKDREIYSYVHNDMIIEEKKLTNLKQRKERGEFQNVHLINFFRDGMLSIETNIDDESVIKERSTRLCNEQTKLDPENIKKIEKKLVHYNQRLKAYFAFRYDKNTNNFYVVFSQNTINTNLLNYEENQKIQMQQSLF